MCVRARVQADAEGAGTVVLSHAVADMGHGLHRVRVRLLFPREVTPRHAALQFVPQRVLKWIFRFSHVLPELSRYKLLELLGYVAMGAVPALVILSMVIIKKATPPSQITVACVCTETLGALK